MVYSKFIIDSNLVVASYVGELIDSNGKIMWGVVFRVLISMLSNRVRVRIGKFAESSFLVLEAENRNSLIGVG